MSAGRGGGRYSRVDRVGKLLREVIAEEIERLTDVDGELGLLTVTDVVVKPDLRFAVVLVASADEAQLEALERARPHLQRSIATQVRLKRTPHLSFEADSVLASAEEIERVLKRIQPGG